MFVNASRFSSCAEKQTAQASLASGARSATEASVVRTASATQTLNQRLRRLSTVRRYAETALVIQARIRVTAQKIVERHRQKRLSDPPVPTPSTTTATS